MHIIWINCKPKMHSFLCKPIEFALRLVSEGKKSLIFLGDKVQRNCVQIGM